MDFVFKDNLKTIILFVDSEFDDLFIPFIENDEFSERIFYWIKNY